MTYDPAFAWGVLGRQGLLDRDGEMQAWKHIIEASESYPVEEYVPPLRAPRRTDKPRELAVFDWQYDGAEVRLSRAVRLLWAVGDQSGVLDAGETDDDTASRFLSLLALPLFARRTVAAWGAADAGFFSFLRQFAPALVRLGCTIEPIASGTRCKALIIRKGRATWWLTDAQEMTGASAVTRSQFETEYAPRSTFDVETSGRLLAALTSFQLSTLSLFKVSLRPTIGSAAMRAAQTHVSSKGWLWRPSPLAVAMCRTGSAMRGGYSHAERYDGPAFKADINKAYTGALGTRLPARMAFVGRPRDVERVGGIYLCKVRGTGVFPIYIGRWCGDAVGFRLEYWNGRECYAILVVSEINGIEALGFKVEPLGGFAHTKTWTLEPFVKVIEGICTRFGRGSAHERTAKLIGNAVYGKLAERPEREEVMYAEKRPAEDWHPMCTIDGEEVPYLWTRSVVSYKPSQHVDVAAHVTGVVRGQLYEGMAVVDAMGGRVVHADTDGLLATVDPSPYLPVHETKPGRWRIEGETQRAIVWGRKGSAYGDDIRSAGFSGLTTDDAAALAAGETVVAPYLQKGAAWGNAAPLTAAQRRARATA